VEKFHEGGWIAALVTGSLVGLCALVRSHYRTVGKRLTALDDILTRIPVATPTRQPPPVREGEPAAVFFVSSYRGVGRIAGDGYPHESYVNLPTLNPHHPTAAYAGLTERIEIGVYEHEPTTVELCLKAASAHAAGAVSVALNGSALVSSGTDQGWSVYRVEPSVLRRGRNAVEIANRSRAPLVVADLRIDVRAAG